MEHYELFLSLRGLFPLNDVGVPIYITQQALEDAGVAGDILENALRLLIKEQEKTYNQPKKGTD